MGQKRPTTRSGGTMKNKINYPAIVLVLTIGVGLGAIINDWTRDAFPAIELSAAETQLREYKEAEKTCGISNVKEDRFIKKSEGYRENDKVFSTEEYLCTDMAIAALSEASRSAIRQDILQQKEVKVEMAKRAITAVFNDQSVSQKETAIALRELKGEIDILLDTLDV